MSFEEQKTTAGSQACHHRHAGLSRTYAEAESKVPYGMAIIQHLWPHFKSEHTIILRSFLQ